MARYSYDRLSGQDNDFLLCETPALPMNIGGAQIFDAGPLRNKDGGIHFEAVKNLVESILHKIPRYRQKLAWIPAQRHSVWVDDPHFDIHYHVRHTSLPRPGTDEQLKLLTSRVMEHPLDRSRPLWVTWVVEGLEGDRFALIHKIHHCMIDGVSGVDLSQILLSPNPEEGIQDAPRFIPRKMPGDAELLIDEFRRQLSLPIDLAAGVAKFLRDTPDVTDEIGRRVTALTELVGWKAVKASDTPINSPVGPHRVIEWRSIPLEQLKAVRKALDCSINDVVLASVAGAVRELMRRRQVDPGQLDFRVSAPVNVRPAGEEGSLGNHVSSWVLKLPIGVADPIERLKIIRESTDELKGSNQASAVEMITSLFDALPVNIPAMAKGTMNTIVTNIPGPQFPLYLLGARMREITPLPPLLENVGLAIGVLSYDGDVFWGFNADYDQLPDLEVFALGVDHAFQELARDAGVDLSSVSRANAVAVASSATEEKPIDWQPTLVPQERDSAVH